MSDSSGALRRVVAQVGANSDAMVDGTPGHARRLLAEAAGLLAGQATVVSVASPMGELSLSTLIAQLSGRLDLDDQDDAVLELGFKRLKGEGPTVLMLLAPAGISRSALRYLQHVSRQSPRLAMVVYGGPALAPMLAETGFAALQARLHALPAIEIEAVAPIAPSRSVALLPSVAVQKRRPVLWAASALVMAAVAGGVWLGHSAPGTAVAGGRTAHFDIPLVPATVARPVLAGSHDPVAADLSLPLAATPGLAATARLPQIALATLPLQPPALPPLIRRADPARREPSRIARIRPYWSSPGSQEPADYGSIQPWDGVSPIWVRRDPRRRGDLGPFPVAPNGVRVYQYDP